MIIASINKSFDELVRLLQVLDNDKYSEPVTSLSNATIGEHTRHIIEMYQCLISSYDSGVVNYDDRKRDKELESFTASALAVISELKKSIAKQNKKLVLRQQVDGDTLDIESNYERELLYNLEHCIHHQALIKVAAIQSNIAVDPDFGVARSTIQYRNRCAQ